MDMLELKCLKNTPMDMSRSPWRWGLSVGKSRWHSWCPPTVPGSIRLPKASLGDAAFRGHSEYFPGIGFHEKTSGKGSHLLLPISAVLSAPPPLPTVPHPVCKSVLTFQCPEHFLSRAWSGLPSALCGAAELLYYSNLIRSVNTCPARPELPCREESCLSLWGILVGGGDTPRPFPGMSIYVVSF